MSLTPRQSERLYRLAEIAHEFSVAQRDRTERYGQGIEYQRRCRFQITQKEGEIGQHQAESHSASNVRAERTQPSSRELHERAVGRLKAEIEGIQTQLRQSEIVTRNLLTEIEAVRPIASSYQERVESVVQHLRTTRAALGINFAAREYTGRGVESSR